jgi:hypothetical protein
VNLARSVRSLWLGTRGVFCGSQKSTVVICPTAELPAQVELDAVQRMESCSRWPELEGCSRACMPQIRFSAEELREFTAPYEGKPCTSCGVAITGGDWYRSRLAAPTEAERPDQSGSLSLSSLEDKPICLHCYSATMLLG